MSLAQCPWQTPVPPCGWLCPGQCPPHQSLQEGSWALPGAPENTLSPWKESWLSPNPQPPTHLPGSSPSVSRPGQVVPELWSKQGVTPGKGGTPTFPKSCFTVGCPPPRHQHLPSQAARAHTPGWPGAMARP